MQVNLAKMISTASQTEIKKAEIGTDPHKRFRNIESNT